MLNLLTQFPEAKSFNLGCLEVLAYGGSPMAPEVVQRTRDLLPNAKLLQCYGLSEAGFLTGLEDQEHVGARLLSCGRPCPGIDLRVEDETGKEVQVGEHGELVARGANVMRGYWNDSQDTALAFRNGMFRTGDVGYQDSDGYFYILDRLKDMIVTGGENVYSGEVEAVIYKHPAVREVAVFGIPDPKWGELVMACVVLKPGMVLSANDLTTHCKQFLANYKIPRRIEFSDTELPKSGSGKILKRILRDRFWALRSTGLNGLRKRGAVHDSLRGRIMPHGCNKQLLIGYLSMAERVGFEPTVEFPLHSLSRRALSTAQTPLRSLAAELV